MTRARKYSGKTVDEATEIALAELDAELEDVEIRVVSTGRSGILGFGGEPAEIEISLLSEVASSFDDDFEDEVDDSQEFSEEPADPESEEKISRSRNRSRNRKRGRGRGRNGRGDEAQQADAPEIPTAETDSASREEKSGQSDGESSDRGRRNGRRGNLGRSNDSSESNNLEERTARTERSPRPDRPARKERAERNEDSQPIIREKDEKAEKLVSELIDYFLGAMGVVAETYIREDDEEGSMTFEIEGQDAGLLIGRRGETLEALQFLIRTVTNRQLGRKAYVVIDIEDYRERRVQMLGRLARRTAGRVGSSGNEDSLEPMSPAERRIVHMALAGHPEVRTESEGEGNQRRVVIFPND